MASRPPDLAIMIPDLRVGGVERQSLRLAEAFEQRGLTVELVLHQAQGELLGAVPPRVRLRALGVDRFRKSLPAMLRYLGAQRPRAVLARMWPVTTLALWARAAASPASRVVISDHNHMSATGPGRPGLRRALMSAAMRASYPLADGVVAVSAGVADDLAALAGLPRSRVRVIYNPVTPLAPPGEVDRARITPWLEAPGPRLISVGTLKVQKDYPTLLRALVRLRRGSDARLLIVGEGPERPTIEALIRQLELGGVVTLAGLVPNPHAYVALADLFVLSSRYEGFGNVLVEALATGTPVVSTRCPSGPSEILDEGRYGRLTPVGDVEALASAIAETLANPPEAALLERRADDFSVAAATLAYGELLGL